ncbi:hypothetical protein [Mesonia sp. K7]|uniref:hypothetical protein n=1 Tax=Mesonia sp. K7 TaxID=2218606 RepID=UPI000DA88F0D|nr:hypothetical protein [Mesonia sp. K7]PZD76542.1 hypothetical protein DNG35_11610 [Mesonia sp. K7]
MEEKYIITSDFYNLAKKRLGYNGELIVKPTKIKLGLKKGFALGEKIRNPHVCLYIIKNENGIADQKCDLWLRALHERGCFLLFLPQL